MRLKALDLYFVFLTQNRHFGVLFPYIVIFQLAIDAREVLADARNMQKIQSTSHGLPNALIPKYFGENFIEIRFFEVRPCFFTYEVHNFGYVSS